MRYLKEALQKDLQRKLVLLSGPRQSGKTTFAKDLSESVSYLNFDVPSDRLLIQQQAWDRSRKLLVLDELHKLKKWKLFLKGIVDADSHKMQTIVTGSARLDISKKVGDSLAGRFFSYRLHPIDVKEAVHHFSLGAQDSLERIMRIGGFPEPFLLNSVGEYRRWKTSHLDVILKQDLIQLETVEQLTQIETLVELLRGRVGSTVAYSNLARDLGCAPKSVKRWIQILENLYVIFRVTPYYHKLTRAIVKAPKFYFYDCGHVLGDDGAKFENLVALSLKKEIEFRQDAEGAALDLHFTRNKDGDEIDFIVTKEERPWLGIEAKWSEDSPHRGFKVFGSELKLTGAIQLVAQLDREKTYPFGLEVRRAADWLARLEFK
jgi:predicted AAA+ superfamily ATPase